MNNVTAYTLLSFAIAILAVPGCGGTGAGSSHGTGGTSASGGATATGGVGPGGSTAGLGGANTSGGAMGSGGVGTGGSTGARDASADTAAGRDTSQAGDGSVARDAGTSGDRAVVPDAKPIEDTPADRSGADLAQAASPDAPGVDGDGAATAARWSMGYYASWNPDQYPIAEIAWSGLTHIAMAFYLPQADGSLQLAGGDDQLATDLIAAAHANGVEAIASIGGSDSQASFQQATASTTVASFASHLAALLDAGYDGIDIDWEPLDKSDEAAVIDIANRVRQAKPGALFTIPIGAINVNLGADLTGYPAIAAAYDQLNIMSYGQAGTWSGWKSWHSSALYQTDSATPTSIDSTVKLYLAAKVPAAKLGIGIGFYGLCYTSPVTGPDQALGGSTIAANDGTMSYANIVTEYASTSARKWDDLAKVPYLSFSSPHAPDNCTYISYDDEQSIAEKGAYVKAQGLGGVIEWELNEGYLAGAAKGARNPLLDAIAGSVLH